MVIKNCIPKRLTNPAKEVIYGNLDNKGFANNNDPRTLALYNDSNLLKIVEETSIAIDAKMTAEMGLIRVAYASGLPTPGDVIKSMSMDHNIVEKTGKVTPNDEIKPSNQAIQEPEKT